MPAPARKPTATSRLMKDYARLQEDPVPYILAEPNPKNVLEWHYVVSGPENSPYFGGQYHGHLVFPADYPFKPPAVYMITPNGRFKTNKKLCLSISDFHPVSFVLSCPGMIAVTNGFLFLGHLEPSLVSVNYSRGLAQLHVGGHVHCRFNGKFITRETHLGAGLAAVQSEKRHIPGDLSQPLPRVVRQVDREPEEAAEGGLYQAESETGRVPGTAGHSIDHNHSNDHVRQ